jgi:acetyl/propionyl-CoA carboxylase alpha subunit
MRHLLTSLANHYDLVIIDAPPLLPVTDAAVLAAAADGAILVIRHGKTRREEVERAFQALASVNAKVLGTVLNFAPRRTRRGGYDSYGYGYGYGPTATPEPESTANSTAASASTANSAAASASGSRTSRRGQTKEAAEQWATARTEAARAPGPTSVTLPPRPLTQAQVQTQAELQTPAQAELHARADLQAQAELQGYAQLQAQTRARVSTAASAGQPARDPSSRPPVLVDLSTPAPGQVIPEQLIPPQGGSPQSGSHQGQSHPGGTGVPRHHRSKRSL